MPRVRTTTWLIMRGMRMIADPIDGTVSHYCDSDDLEVDTARMGRPTVLGVVTGTDDGYTRPGGVVAIPVDALGP